jgi:class 3 adenylate cyclase/tetratricopeptide (TPR) repeat protein
MAACSSCGRDNADDARFCSSCGTALAGAQPAREQRKVVTVLFCDLVGSTSLGESNDPEVVRARLARTFEKLRVILERHGGTVEKFVGDAVMAVFGIPVSHEDDALRAVRAASEMRAAIAEHGLEARIGVNTGEVVVGAGGETLVTGDAVNVAARLEQAAPNGEILIGSETRALVRDAVRVEPVDPLALKGKSEPVEAFRVADVIGDEPLARRLDTPLVGRERERQRLWRVYEDAVADRTCQLFTLLGPAGIGKSRLVADFLERVAESAEVHRGRCLSYGEGITYWPLVEILLAIGIDPASIIGTSPPETQLAFRRLLEARTAERPQVVVVDDLQWAEPVFVDLVEHIADLSRDAPIFLLCIARNELLDSRPDWGGGKLNATSLLLEPLGAAECDTLMERLADGAVLDDDLRERITTASAGNPLYVEEMLAMVREHGEGEVTVPPTIHALLQARIDSLESDVRLVMERGSVEGEVFHRGAVAELAPEPVRPAIATHLATLVRKELIRSTPPLFPADEGYRFRHLLIRDAAYESLPKATRAELHERFAEWLATQQLIEGDEIVGYHLEQAHRYRAELDPADSGLSHLAERAASHLGAAGFGAMDRGDWSAARALLRRARGLLPEGSDARAALAPELSLALQETGEIDEAAAVAHEATTARDPILRARAFVAEADTYSLDSGSHVAAARRRRDEALPVLEAAGDALGLAHYWRSRGYDYWAVCRCAEAGDAWTRGIEYARAAGADRFEHELVGYILSGLVQGSTPVTAAMPRVLEALEGTREGSLGRAAALRALAMLKGFSGSIDEARELIARGVQTFKDAGLLVTAGGWSMGQSELERRAGDVDAQVRILREAYELLAGLGDRFFFPTTTIWLANALLDQDGDVAEVEALCAVARERTIAGDLANFIGLGWAEARLLARQDRVEEAEGMARRTVERVDATDHFLMVGRSRVVLAEILQHAGRFGEAGSVASEAISIYESKEDVAGAAAWRSYLGGAGVALS